MPERRRVLMIAHHFPPAGGSGSNRALAWSRYLPEHAWEPVVLTPGQAWASNRDDQLLAEIPRQLRVVRTRSFEARPALAQHIQLPASARSSPPRPSVLRSHVGHLKRFPDAHLGWLPHALAAARRLEYDVAYSSSGPFTSHVVGLLLKRISSRPWVAELRDGWYRWNRAIFADYPSWRDAVELRLEAAVVRTADRVVLVTERMAHAFRCQYPDLPPAHFSVVANGFDASQFEALPVHQRFSASFEVLHAGAVYSGRSVAALLQAAGRLVESDPAFDAAFRLKLVGTLDPAARAELSLHAPAGHVEYGGQLDHRATLSAMRRADLLLLVANTTPGAEATVPGKVFEYLGTGRPILAVAPKESSTTDVLLQTGGAWLAPAGDAEQIACALHAAFRAHQAGVSRLPDPNQVAHYDRRLLAGDLARIFDQVS